MTVEQKDDIKNSILARLSVDLQETEIFLDGLKENHTDIDGIYDLHSDDVAEHIAIEQNSNKWDAEYFNAQIVELSYNFSKERLEHVLKVAKGLYSKLSNTVESNVQQEKSIQIPVSKKKIFLLLGVLGIVAIAVIVAQKK